MSDSESEPEPEVVLWPYSVESSDEEDSTAMASVDNKPSTAAKHPAERCCLLGVKSPYEKQENLEDRDELFTHLENLLSGQYGGDCCLDGSKRCLLREYHSKS